MSRQSDRHVWGITKSEETLKLDVVLQMPFDIVGLHVNMTLLLVRYVRRSAIVLVLV